MSIKTVFSVIVTALIFGALAFIPAGTFFYVGGWQLIASIAAMAVITGSFLKKYSKDLLKRRLGGRKDGMQTVFEAEAAFLIGIVPLLCGLDYRFGLFDVILPVRALFFGIFVLGFVLYLRVMYENRYLFSELKTTEGQKLVDTGLYGIVRHPMYTAVCMMYISLPVSCGSLLALAGIVFLPAFFIRRISLEESLLEKQLEGYTAYKDRVRYKMVPFIW